MAKKKTSEKSTGGIEGTGPGMDEPMPDDSEEDDDFQSTPPEGFTRRNANDSAGWVAKVKGNIVYGMLLGRFTRSDGGMVADDGSGATVRHFYQVKLLQTCKLSIKEEDRTEDGQTRDAKKGDVVNLDENKGIEGLQEAIKEGGYTVVWVLYKGKISQQKNRGRKFWDIDCRTQKRNAPF